MNKNLLLFFISILFLPSIGQEQNNFTQKKGRKIAILKHDVHANEKISVVTAQRFTGSMNVYGVLCSESNLLNYNSSLNALTFFHRKSPFYIPSANGNEGSVVAMYSTNLGTSWDSTCVWANSTYTAQIPQGLIYNPAGNTNLNNAYLVGCGPVQSGTNNVGNWYASKSLFSGPTTTPGVDQQAIINGISPLKKHSNAQFAINSIEGGLVRTLSNIVNDPNATTKSAYGLRGAAMSKGQFNAGAFMWSIDSFVPAVESNTVANYRYLDDKPLQAWSENGQTGYVVMLGVRAGIPANNRSYQLIIYKTTNSGMSWSLLPAQNYAALNGVMCLMNRIWPMAHVPGKVPRFSNHEGWDATVDINGNLHVACLVLGAYSNHPDSLDYYHEFTSEKYKFPSANFYWPTIYDFYTTSFGGIIQAIVDTMYSEGPSGVLGEPGYNYNYWTDGGTKKIGYDARIQISRSIDGRKIYYSWAETDTSIGGTRWNIYPDIMLRGYDVTIDKRSPTYNITAGLTTTTPDILSGAAFFHYMSPVAIGNSSVSCEIPFSVSMTSATSLSLVGNAPVNHYFIKGATLLANTCTLSTMFPNNCSTIPITLSSEENNLEREVKLFPNPTADKANLKIDSEKSSEINISVINSLGMQLKSENKTMYAGENELEIDFSDLAEGFYYLKIENSITSQIFKVVVSR